MSSDRLYGLVLSGGKSSRMGSDKSTIAYHGIPQREHLYHLLNQVCDKTFLSVRTDQVQELPNDIPVIVDKNEYKGPYNGLLSAHLDYPDAAWLVLACDLPLMDSAALGQLIAHRDPKKKATAFATRESGLPEPLCAIWEPDGLKDSFLFLNNGTVTCPRKFLINSEVALVYPVNDKVLLNANSKEDYEEAISKLNSK
ncbi:NTP transferase domain-containing protein [Arenibacter sp. GZD96]|uniref:NTP transferase domain-containing protein n=1 Tax=Aurantibrevibacter litoralis TaxID=3106030 RepID=UPI002AFF4F52|nr:NTP transferase domain-containing protein [Arenibacter sp. GZD-96]MEA1785344.1 NTP transferase domain-containing protein [Arenibacter sp. GZD-96]